jgi:hypothetical protein
MQELSAPVGGPKQPSIWCIMVCVMEHARCYPDGPTAGAGGKNQQNRTAALAVLSCSAWFQQMWLNAPSVRVCVCMHSLVLICLLSCAVVLLYRYQPAAAEGGRLEGAGWHEPWVVCMT